LNFYLVSNGCLGFSLIIGQIGEAAANNAVARIAERLKKFTL